jgi:hypothetical protein
MKKRILYICGSMNQTTQMHHIANELNEYDSAFTPYYCDGVLDVVRRYGLIEFSILGNKHIKRCLRYLRDNNLPVDFRGRRGEYDLVVTCSDLIVPDNIRGKRVVLVQEGMTDPDNMFTFLARHLSFFPRWLGSTSTTGMSNQYDRFCVASEGYRDLFIRKGLAAEKIIATGIPNFDNCRKYLNNAFTYSHHVLVCTSDMRETFKYENRKRFILRVLEIAKGKQVIFKLHPNENLKRATAEIQRYAPEAIVFQSGSAEEMIANADVLITRLSSTVFVGLALGKEVYSDFDINYLKRLVPLQHGRAARNIADVCRSVPDREERPSPRPAIVPDFRHTQRIGAFVNQLRTDVTREGL